MREVVQRDMNGICWLYVRDMSEQHIPLAKPSTHGRFKRITGYVGGYYFDF